MRDLTNDIAPAPVRLRMNSVLLVQSDQAHVIVVNGSQILKPLETSKKWCSMLLPFILSLPYVMFLLKIYFE